MGQVLIYSTLVDKSVAPSLIMCQLLQRLHVFAVIVQPCAAVTCLISVPKHTGCAQGCLVVGRHSCRHYNLQMRQASLHMLLRTQTVAQARHHDLVSGVSLGSDQAAKPVTIAANVQVPHADRAACCKCALHARTWQP